MIDIHERHPNLECEICDDYDHCLPRWEDDGGGVDRPPSFVEDSEGHHGRPDQPTDGRRDRPIRGLDGGCWGGGKPGGSPLRPHEP